MNGNWLAFRRRIRFVLPILITLFVIVLCFSTPGLAANTGQLKIPFDTTVINPCNGEEVVTSGVVHIDATITVTKQNIILTSVANPQGVTGIGQTTGATYHATGVTATSESFSVVNSKLTFTSINRFDFVATASGPSFELHDTTHITVNADGTLTAFIDNVGTTCK